MHTSARRAMVLRYSTVSMGFTTVGSAGSRALLPRACISMACTQHNANTISCSLLTAGGGTTATTQPHRHKTCKGKPQTTDPSHPRGSDTRTIEFADCDTRTIFLLGNDRC